MKTQWKLLIAMILWLLIDVAYARPPWYDWVPPPGQHSLTPQLASDLRQFLFENGAMQVQFFTSSRGTNVISWWPIEIEVPGSSWEKFLWGDNYKKQLQGNLKIIFTITLPSDVEMECTRCERCVCHDLELYGKDGYWISLNKQEENYIWERAMHLLTQVRAFLRQ